MPETPEWPEILIEKTEHTTPLSQMVYGAGGTIGNFGGHPVYKASSIWQNERILVLFPCKFNNPETLEQIARWRFQVFIARQLKQQPLTGFQDALQQTPRSSED